MFGFQTQKTTKTTKTNTAIMNFPRPDMDKLTNSFNIILDTFQKTGLYKDDASITDDLQETILILQKIYTYIYNPKSSNLTQQDAQVFVGRLMDKMKTLKKTVDVMK